MIASNVAMALSIARGIIKLAGRADRLLAEKVGVTSDLILTMPTLSGGPGGIQMTKELKNYVEETKNNTPDPLSSNRGKIEELLKQPAPDPAQITKWYGLIFPERAIFPVLDPDSEYIKNLKNLYPEMDLKDKDTRAAAFYIGPGKDHRQIGYAWRMAMLVLDVVSEFGAENTSLFVRDEKIRSIVQAVLERFSKPDFESYHVWSPFLLHALSSTLNGVLDARHAYQDDDKWLTAMLGALATAREKAEDGDNYILGLFQSKGYPLLISEGLSAAALTLDYNDAGDFEKITADVLREAAPLVKGDTNFRYFFQDHWGDLFRAGLCSAEKYGSKMLEEKSPLMRETLLAVVKELSTATDAQLLSPEVVFKITDAALGAVSLNPDLILDVAEPEWLKKLISSVIETAGNQGIRKTFSKKGFEAIVSSAAGTMAEYPELIIKEPGLVQKLVGSTLKAVGSLDNCLDAEAIASAAVKASLEVVVRNPDLLDTRYPDFLVDCAKRLAALVGSKKISRIQAADIVTAAAEAMVLNPVLFDEFEGKLAGEVVETVVELSDGDDAKLIAGATLVEVTRLLLGTIACRGRRLIGKGSVTELGNRLTKVLNAGLTCAVEELGHHMDVSSLPMVLSGLVAAVAQGDITVVDPNDPQFMEFFMSLADHSGA